MGAAARAINKMSGPLLRGADVAAFAVALVARLRGVGVRVSPSGPAGLVQVLRQLTPHTRSQLYWAARLTLVDRWENFAAFDSVFDAVFAHAATDLDPSGLRRSLSSAGTESGSTCAAR